MGCMKPYLTKITLLLCVFWGSLSLSNLVSAEQPSESALQGKWWILGNVTRGTLEITIDVHNEVSGLVYNQPIRGRFDSARREVTFVRYSDANASVPMQHWTGKLVDVDCNGRKVSVLEGTFRTLDVGTEEEKKQEYQWSGQSVSAPAPSLDMKSLQGEWKLHSITKCTRPEVKLPDEIGLVAASMQFTIQRNQIVVDSEVTATIANDLQAAKLASEVGFDGSRLMVLTTSSGQGLICSYFIDQDVVEIAYPHTTSCHRGSGHILRLTRLPKTPD